MAVSFNKSVILAGGRASGGLGFTNDVWRSADGSKWDRVVAAAPWPKRSYHSLQPLQNCLYLFGGQDFGTFYNDVWQSCDSGATWKQLAKAPWPARAGQGALTIADKYIMVAAGCYNAANGTRSFWGDVWVTSDGSKWTMQTAQAEFSARSGPRLVVTEDGRIIIVAGERGFTPDVQLDDVWQSLDLGKTWTLLSQNPGFSGRSGHGVVYFSGRALLLAGWLNLHDLWQSDVAVQKWSLLSNQTFDCQSASCGRFDFWVLVHQRPSGPALIMMGGSGAESTFGKLYDETWALPLTSL